MRNIRRCAPITCFVVQCTESAQKLVSPVVGHVESTVVKVCSGFILVKIFFLDSQSMSYVTIAPPPPSRPIIRSIFPDATPLVNNNGANFFHPGSQLKPVLSALSTAGATLKPGAKEWTNYSRKVESAKRFRQLVEHLKWRHAQPAALEMPRSYVQVEKVSSGLAEKPGRAPILSSSRDSLCGNTLHDAECESQRDRCVDIFFFHIMLENCAQTCGFCEANGWVRVAGGGRGGARSVKDGGGDSSSASRKQVLFKNLNPIKFGCFYF